MGIFYWPVFWATVTGAGVAAPRHNKTSYLTIEEMLGFGHVEPISLFPDFFISGFFI